MWLLLQLAHSSTAPTYSSYRHKKLDKINTNMIEVYTVVATKVAVKVKVE